MGIPSTVTQIITQVIMETAKGVIYLFSEILKIMKNHPLYLSFRGNKINNIIP